VRLPARQTLLHAASRWGERQLLNGGPAVAALDSRTRQTATLGSGEEPQHVARNSYPQMVYVKRRSLARSRTAAIALRARELGPSRRVAGWKAAFGNSVRIRTGCTSMLAPRGSWRKKGRYEGNIEKRRWKSSVFRLQGVESQSRGNDAMRIGPPASRLAARRGSLGVIPHGNPAKTRGRLVSESPESPVSESPGRVGWSTRSHPPTHGSQYRLSIPPRGIRRERAAFTSQELPGHTTNFDI
jgi:hypothetical protein